MDQHRKRNLFLVSAASALMVSGLAMATVSEAPSAGTASQAQVSAETQVEPLQERPKPPQVALDACRNRAEGEACSVTFRDKTISGTCRKMPGADDGLVCLPEGFPPAAPPP